MIVNWLLSWLGVRIAPLRETWDYGEARVTIEELGAAKANLHEVNATLRAEASASKRSERIAIDGAVKAYRERDLYRLEADFVKSRLEEQSALRVKLARYEAAEARVESCVDYQPWLDADLPSETMQ